MRPTPPEIYFATGALDIALCAVVFTLILVIKSLVDYSRTGPQLKDKIIKNYLTYTVFSVTRLAVYTYFLIFIQLLLGKSLYDAIVVIFSIQHDLTYALITACLFFFSATTYSFLKLLLYTPSTIISSWQYNVTRLYPIWNLLSPIGIKITGILLISFYFIPLVTALVISTYHSYSILQAYFATIILLSIITPRLTNFRRIKRRGNLQSANQPNILLIGTDTLRVDHISSFGYSRSTTPTIDELAKKSFCLTNCYTPLARTAPSLACLHTGILPQKMGIIDNFVDHSNTCIPDSALPKIFKENGYITKAISDWAGADLKKFNFGYDIVDTPEDQWNIKYYLRQGPMPLRLFLSLFSNNRIGKYLLPEIFYQAGNPLTQYLTNETINSISELATKESPFFLNVFMGTTHAPFGSEHPNYLKFSNGKYSGESKFVMFTYSDPNDVIDKQEQTVEAFDLDQIKNLYDGCIYNFDNAVKQILNHLTDTGLVDNTIVVIYSDHGTDFYENGVWGQGNTLFGRDHSARVPVIIHSPSYSAGIHIQQVTRQYDIAPTLLDLCNIPIPNGDGVSLKPLFENPHLDLNLPAYQETGIWLGDLPNMHPEHIRYPGLLELLDVPDISTGTLSIKPKFVPIIEKAKDRMIRKGKWKLIALPLNNRIEYFLFDMENDPDCQNNLTLQYPDIVKSLKNELAKHMSET